MTGRLWRVGWSKKRKASGRTKIGPGFTSVRLSASPLTCKIRTQTAQSTGEKWMAPGRARRIPGHIKVEPTRPAAYDCGRKARGKMPKRTNDFQKLIHQIQSTFFPGAKVTESAMEPDSDGWREIDVLVEAGVGPYVMKIAFEAKDHARPLDKTAIEGISKKYDVGGVAVNKVVVVARHGFTSGAIEKAKLFRIELMTVKEAIQSDWSKHAPQLFTIDIQPHITALKLVSAIRPTPLGGDPLISGRLLCKCCRKNMGSPAQWAKWILETQILANPECLQGLAEESKRRGSPVSGVIVAPLPNHALAYGGEISPITAIELTIEWANATAPGKWSTFQVESKETGVRSVDRLEAQFGRTGLSVVFPHGHSSEVINISFANVPAKGSEREQLMGGMEIKRVPTIRYPHSFVNSLPYPKKPISQTRQRPAKRSGRKRIGRNEPCICGSGKKFKYCCLNKI